MWDGTEKTIPPAQQTRTTLMSSKAPSFSSFPARFPTPTAQWWAGALPFTSREMPAPRLETGNGCWCCQCEEAAPLPSALQRLAA